MIATAQAKFLACSAIKGKDKVENREFTYYKYDFLTPETGVSTFTGGKDFSHLVDKNVLITFDVMSKTEVKLNNVEEFSDGERTIN